MIAGKREIHDIAIQTTCMVPRLYVQVTQAIVQLPTFIDGRLFFAQHLGRVDAHSADHRWHRGQ
jgi:hypothetical protein